MELDSVLLTKEEEIKYGKDLVYSKGNIYNKTKLDLDILFTSLTNNIPVKETLLKLKNSLYMIDSETYSTYINTIKKYLSLFHDKVLTKEELSKTFKMQCLNYIDENLLLVEIDNYINYVNARNQMIIHNLRLVSKLANKYSALYQVEYDDLYMVGIEGLMSAVERFNYKLDIKFSTYATSIIKPTIKRYIDKCKSTLTIPTNFFNEMIRFRKYVEGLEKEVGRKFTIAELAKITNLKEQKIYEYITYNNDHISLDSYTYPSESPLIDTIEDRNHEIDDMLFELSVKSTISNFCALLTPEEEEFFKLKYGLDRDYRSRTTRDVAKLMKINLEKALLLEKIIITKAHVMYRKLEKNKGNGYNL